MKFQPITILVAVFALGAVAAPESSLLPRAGLSAGELCNSNRGECDGNGNCDDLSGKGKKKDPACANMGAAPGPGAGKAEAFSANGTVVVNTTTSAKPAKPTKKASRSTALLG